MLSLPSRSFALTLLVLASSGAAHGQPPSPPADPLPAPPAASPPPAPAARPRTTQPALPERVQLGERAEQALDAAEATEAPAPHRDPGVDSGVISAPPDERTRAGRFEGGLRTGFAMPFGKAGETRLDPIGVERDVGDLVGYRVPIWIDVGYRASAGVHVGAYGQIGLGGGGDCAGSCNASDIRLGAQVLFHTAPGSSADVWLGIGAGWEWLSTYQLVTDSATLERNPDFVATSSVRVGETLAGPELTIQLGLDLDVEPGLSLGPFAVASVGQYLSDGFECRGVACPTDGDLEGGAFHGWLGVGLRGSYAP